MKIIHNDLRLSNILVFGFPQANHLCLSDKSTTSVCEECQPSSGSCGVLVKVADMGISANLAIQKGKSKQGIRRFIPECLSFNANLTTEVSLS